MSKQANNSREITDAQSDIHQNLEKLVRKHCDNRFQKPIAKHTQDAFDAIKNQVENSLLKHTPLLFDSFCGTAMSTAIIARQHPNALVIGIDRSAVRLAKEYNQAMPDNVLLVHAECGDFWRLAVDAGWKLNKHFILYPNPYPKSKHIKRRVHGHPAYPNLLELGGHVELRTNWKIYADEFCQALQYSKQAHAKPCRVEPLSVDQPLTLFEKKYHEAGQELFICQYSL